MAKDKKRGFFSWFGRGRQEEEQQKEETREEVPVVEEPGVPVEPEPIAEPEPVIEPEPLTEPLTEPEPDVEEPARLEAAEELAEEIVHITELVAAQQVIEESAVAEPVVIEAEIEEPIIVDAPVVDEPVVLEEQIIEDDFVESAAEIAEDAREDSLDAVDDNVVVENEPLPVAMDPIVVLPAGETEQERPTKEGFFARLKRSLVKTRQNLGSGFVGLFRGKKIDDDLFEELEEQLLIADVGVETTRKIITSLTEHASRKQLKDADALYGKLKEEMSEILSKVEQPLDVSGKTPYVILMVGVNGVGKTTTIGKMARQFEAQGKSVMLAAGDTFRAAAVEQLQVWGQRNKIPVIAQHTGADSASVIFDAIQAAKARGIDVLIADTAGRLQNKAHLMEELKKIVRVMKKLDEDAPHEVMLTLDASTGQNAVSQAKLFNEAVGLTGITLTKLDGTAKGGVIFAIADQFSIPIRYIGVGEGIEDLRPFKADDFIEALFARED
ncbi:signal recognition particle-docking protein FtsY [Rahnella inusitata]|uniref:signal recognition particle-docking protein FtsY n=1 Tax=Rahnella inusitata TaxID=58169 RepID=UPI0039BDB58C